jgi:hypothetical protein
VVKRLTLSGAGSGAGDASPEKGHQEAAMIRNLRIGRIPAAVAVLAVALTHAVSASALDLPFSMTTGFSATNATEAQLVGGGAPVANRGGLEFSTAVTAPPGAPLGDNTAPPNIWEGVAWGCLLGAEPPATCANGGVVGNGTGFPDGSTNPARSALSVEGQFGVIQENVWTDITIIQHFNHVIDARSNILKTVDINSILRLGSGNRTVQDSETTSVEFTETLNDGDCTDLPTFGAPVNPLRSNCDDFALVSGLDLTSQFIPAGAVGNRVAYTVDFRLSAATGSGVLVCDGSADQPAACAGYNGQGGVVIYTAEGSTNTLSVQALLRPATVTQPLPLFVIGDVEPHAVGNVVNFWGAQWHKNNVMSGFVSNGVASFKGYASNAQDFCGGTWQTRPGNSSNPPATIPAEVAVIVTDTVLKNGPNISGNIKQIVIVRHDGKYGPNPGHRGSGPVVRVFCTAP